MSQEWQASPEIRGILLSILGVEKMACNKNMLLLFPSNLGEDKTMSLPEIYCILCGKQTIPVNYASAFTPLSRESDGGAIIWTNPHTHRS